MAAKDYKLCVSEITGTVFISKVSKIDPSLMLDDRIVVPDNELIEAIHYWASSKLKGDSNVLNLTKEDKVVAQIKLLDKSNSQEEK